MANGKLYGYKSVLYSMEILCLICRRLEARADELPISGAESGVGMASFPPVRGVKRT